MKKESFLPLYPIKAEPKNNPFASAKSPNELLRALIEEAQRRQNPRLTSQLGEVQGLYTGFDRTKYPDLAAEAVMKLGQVVGEMLTEGHGFSLGGVSEQGQNRLPVFLQYQRQRVKKADYRLPSQEEFLLLFDEYLKLKGKSEQTRKIYRGKAKAILQEARLKTPLVLHEVQEYFLILHRNPKKDHNCQSALSALLDFLRALLQPETL